MILILCSDFAPFSLEFVKQSIWIINALAAMGLHKLAILNSAWKTRLK